MPAGSNGARSGKNLCTGRWESSGRPPVMTATRMPARLSEGVTYIEHPRHVGDLGLGGECLLLGLEADGELEAAVEGVLDLGGEVDVCAAAPVVAVGGV